MISGHIGRWYHALNFYKLSELLGLAFKAELNVGGRLQAGYAKHLSSNSK
jgi:hypothetical protein